MTREELIKQCRFYKGEEECPDKYKNEDHLDVIWGYEETWVESLLEDKNAFKEHEKIYKRDGLTHFREDENPPLSYKSYVYTRFCYWLGGYGHDRDAANFREWYNDIYS